MRCAWQEYINLLPIWMREFVDRQGKESLNELRLRLGVPPELIRSYDSLRMVQPVTVDDISFCINAASRYSPWSSATAKYGYITALGGHRIGICGTASISNGIMSGISMPTSLCIRVARDFPGIAKQLSTIRESILIIGKPGSGKTTLLRDLVRLLSENSHESISVVDEKGEIFPYVRGKMCFPVGSRTDVLTGCSKSVGINSVLRNMGPGTIAVDEITAAEDCQALIHAGWCGVRLIATAHAETKEDLYARPVYRPLIDTHLFDTLILLQPDKSWRLERMRK